MLLPGLQKQVHVPLAGRGQMLATNSQQVIQHATDPLERILVAVALCQ